MKALVIEDDAGWREIVCTELLKANIQPDSFPAWPEALVHLQNKRNYSMVILDLYLSPFDHHPYGLVFLRELRNKGIMIPVVIVTGVSDISTNAVADLYREWDVCDFIHKTSFSSSNFQRAIERLQQRDNPTLDCVKRICERFHLVAGELRNKRREGRDTLAIGDEYDVQDLLRGLLQINFADVRAEEWVPSYAGVAGRMDFLLKDEKIVVEVKKTRKALRHKEVSEQLIIDAARYRNHSDCEILVCLIYDPEQLIRNATGLERDLTKLSDASLKVVPIIVPRM
jgi:FixJ family two-component response regulator